MKISIALSMLVACACVAPAFAIPPTVSNIEPYTRHDSFNRVKISPDGKYLAMSVQLGDHTNLVVLDPVTLKPVSVFAVAARTHVQRFWWANGSRLLVSLAENDGSLDQPVSTGEIWAGNADGKDQGLLFGYRASNDQQSIGGRIKTDRQAEASATVIDTLPGDPGHVLIAVTPWTFSAGQETYTTLEKFDVREGHRNRLGTLPLRTDGVLTDSGAHARFVYGEGADAKNRLYYRDNDNAAWVLINDENVSKRVMVPMGFSADNSVAYVRASEPVGPDSLQRFDVATHAMTPLLVDKTADPDHLLYAGGEGRDPIGVVYLDGKPRVTYFNPDSDAARTHRSLMATFEGQFVERISATADGGIELVETYSDRDSGDVYRFDKSAKKAELLFSRREWLDPAKMAEQKPFEFKARDGLSIHGYLTLPPGSTGKSLPMVVYPHGGPFGISDEWRFNEDVQLLAANGYAVLQVNYRGSGDRGVEFEHAGYRQYGGKMEDDLADATRWAIESGAADKSRVCIYGASYGGYAALMGVARDPGLYRCAVGYAGIYDLQAMYQSGDIQQSKRGKSYLETTLGKENLDALSPVQLANRIKVPVFLAAGGEDKRAPIFHTNQMEAALKKAGASVKTLTYPNEGHGFYDLAHVTEFDRQLLEFLDKNIGSGAKSGAAP